jgi:hypothetical protein
MAVTDPASSRAPKGNKAVLGAIVSVAACAFSESVRAEFGLNFWVCRMVQWHPKLLAG